MCSARVSASLNMPWNLHRCHDITCLFIVGPQARSHYYVQVRSRGRPDWRTLDVREYFPMQPFGHRAGDGAEQS